MNRGLFIVLEGIDRSGKTSQCALLLEHLDQYCMNQGYYAFPNRMSDSGRLINTYLRGKLKLDDIQVHSLFSANRRELQSEIREMLLKNGNVVVDRYAHSGLAYSIAKGLDMEWCKSTDNGIIRPDLIVYIDIKPEIVQTRAEYGAERYENIEFQKKVYEAYGLIKEDSWIVVDGTQSPEDIQVQIAKAVDEALSKDRGLIKRLW